jgi:hypothetical protein
MHSSTNFLYHSYIKGILCRQARNQKEHLYVPLAWISFFLANIPNYEPRQYGLEEGHESDTPPTNDEELLV